jgi:O-antigen/teichoic acid export membrane protein
MKGLVRSVTSRSIKWPRGKVGVLHKSIRRVKTLATERTTLVVGGSMFARLTILLVLVAASAQLSRQSFQFVAYTLAVTTAAQVLLDPQTASFLLTKWYSNTADQIRAEYRSGLILQGIAAAMVALAPLIVGLATGADGHELELGISLGVLAGVEGLCRYSRVSWQASERFGWYAAVDIALGIGRLVTVVVLLANPTLAAFTMANLFVAATIITLLIPAYRALPTPSMPAESWSVARLFYDVLPYGASTTFSSLYAQAPAVLIGLRGSLGAAAAYSVAVRLTQPTELVPLSLASTYLPKLVQSDEKVRQAIARKMVVVALSFATVGAALLIALSPLILGLFNVELHKTQLVLGVLAIVLLPKFVNYQLVALAIADGRIRQRLACAATVAVFSVVWVLILAPQGAIVVACVSLASELLLLSLLVRTGIHGQRRLGKARYGRVG